VSLSQTACWTTKDFRTILASMAQLRMNFFADSVHIDGTVRTQDISFSSNMLPKIPLLLSSRSKWDMRAFIEPVKTIFAERVFPFSSSIRKSSSISLKINQVVSLRCVLEQTRHNIGEYLLVSLKTNCTFIITIKYKITPSPVITV